MLATGFSPVAPVVTFAKINPGGDTANVEFSKPVYEFSSGSEGFTLTGLSGGATTLAFNSQSDDKTVAVFDISRTVSFVETGGALGYTPGDIKSFENVALAAFSNFGVSNFA